jgi:dipeptidyl aminopeptidase/acylaminoacyl peptidase
VLLLGVFACRQQRVPEATSEAGAGAMSVGSAQGSVAAPKPGKADAVANVATVVVVRTGADESQSLWSAASDGKVAELPWPKPSEVFFTFAIELGSDRLQVSPDHRKAAYVAKRALLVRDLEQNVSRVLRPATKDVELALTAWSPDGQELLFARAPHPKPPPGAEADTFGDRAEYHLVSLNTGQSRRVVLPKGQSAAFWPYAGFSADNLVVVWQGDQIVAAGAAAPRILLQAPHRLSQLSVHRDGRHAVAVESDDGPPRRERIVHLDLQTGEVHPEKLAATFDDEQWPRLSPSGRRIAWVHYDRLPGGVVVPALVVDGRVRTGPKAAASDRASEVPNSWVTFHWIDDSSLVLVGPDRIDVLACPPP